MLQTIALWIDERLKISKLFAATAGHTVPANTGSWFYVLAAGHFVVLHPPDRYRRVPRLCSTSADQRTSLQHLNNGQYLGWFLRAIHYWGSNFMVAIMTLHMIQVFPVWRL